MGASAMTRRRALELGAATGLLSLLAPHAAARSRASARGFTLPVERFAGRSETLRAPRRFDLLGVRGDLDGVTLEVRVRPRGGRWSPWVPLGHGHAHRPDTGEGHRASDPVWAGGADELELRGTPRGDLVVHFVAVTKAAKRRGARAVAAADKARSAQNGPPAIITREGWGGDKYPPRSAPNYGEVQVAFVHHTVSANGYAPADSPGIVQSICKYHRDTNGWNDIGYNFLVDRFGQVFEGRAGGIDQAVIGAQAQGYNGASTGIAAIGTFTDAPLDEPAVDAIARLIAWKLPLHGVPVDGTVVVRSGGGDRNRYAAGTEVTFERISGHRDGDSTACPGDQLYGQLAEVRRRAAEIAPAIAAAVRVTMDPPAQAAPYGGELALAGAVVRGDGTPVAGERVLVQKRGRNRWSTLGRATTNPDGTWQASITWRRAGRLRARVAVPGAKVAVSPPLAVELLPVITGRTYTRRIRAGRVVTVEGTVRPVAPVRVTIDREVRPGVFRRAGEVTVRPRGSRFAAAVRLRRPGLYRLTPRTSAKPDPVAAPALFVRAVRRGSVGVDPGSAGGVGA